MKKPNWVTDEVGRVAEAIFFAARPDNPPTWWNSMPNYHKVKWWDMARAAMNEIHKMG